MSYEALVEEIKELPEECISELNNIVISMKLRYKAQEEDIVSNSCSFNKQDRLRALLEFAGSMKDTWKDVDALEYQKTLREERFLG
ncbi:MAG: hypothetical protein IJL80_04685 [Treponema sp.]|nr:hypothetical protein [Treponema sp.]